MIDSRYGTTENNYKDIHCEYCIFSIDEKSNVITNNNRHTYSCFYTHTLKAFGLPEKPRKGHLYVA